MRQVISEMRDAFLERASLTAKQCYYDPQHFPKIGLECELALLDGVVPVSSKRFLGHDCVDKELGDSQLELRTDPVILGRISDLEDELVDKQRSVSDPVMVRIGAIPNISVGDVVTADEEKYRLVPAFHDENRGAHVDTRIGDLDFDCASCVGLFCSTQFNVQADSLDDAVDKLNRSLMIVPYVVALSANARVVDCQDSGFDDVRMPAWECSHDVRSSVEVELGVDSRVGLPSRYFDSIQDYFLRCASHPFILDDPAHAFEIGIGLNWNDVRIKFREDVPIVEFRAMSVQPSAIQDVAMAAFYLGRLKYSQHFEESLQDLGVVRRNRLSAMRYGLSGSLCGEGKLRAAHDVLGTEVRKAEQGLALLGYSNGERVHYLNILRRRLADKKSPSAVFVDRLGSMPLADALDPYRI